MRRLSAASVLRHEVREEPVGAGGEVGLVVCKPGGRAAGETGDEAACVAAPASLSRSPSLRQLTSLDLSHSVVARNKGDVPADELLRVVSSLTALTSLSVRDFANYYSNCDGTLPLSP